MLVDGNRHRLNGTAHHNNPACSRNAGNDKNHGRNRLDANKTHVKSERLQRSSGMHHIACRSSKSMHRKQYRCNHHSRIAKSKHSTEIRDITTENRLPSRHRQLHSSMPHPLRCADTPRHRFGRHIPRCPLALSVLPLDPRTDDHHLHTDQTQNRIIRRVRRSISSSERKQMRREMWRSEDVRVFGVSPM